MLSLLIKYTQLAHCADWCVCDCNPYFEENILTVELVFSEYTAR